MAAQLNRLMLEEVETGHYFTMILAHVDLASGKVAMAQAGHPSPMVQGADGAVRLIGDGGMPIGLLPDAVFEAREFTLMPGERLVIVSDGFGECPNARRRLPRRRGADRDDRAHP